MTSTSADSRTVTIPVKAVARRGFGRNGGWNVTMPGGVTGYGMTLPTARENAASIAASLLSRANEQPAFGVLPSGAVIVAVPDGLGCGVWRVGDGRVSCAGFTTSEPTKAVAEYGAEPVNPHAPNPA